MRIIHVSDSFTPGLGGIEAQVSRLARKQAERGHQVSVLTTTMAHPRPGLPLGSDAGLFIEPLTAEVSYTVVRSQWPNPLGLPIDPHAPSRFVELIIGERPDVVHVHFGELGPVAMSVLALLTRSDIPTVASIHSIWSSFPTVSLYRAVARRFLLDHAPVLWLPVSEASAKPVRQVVNPALVRVYSNAVEPSDWRVTPQPHDGLVAVCATRFAPRKRVPELLRMLRKVGAELCQNAEGISAKRDHGSSAGFLNADAGEGIAPRLRVVIAGDGQGLGPARVTVERWGMAAWVWLPGRLGKEELLDLYARSDVYLAPGVKDAHSVAGVEARAAGLAILSRSQSGFGASVLDGMEGEVSATDEEMAGTLVRWARRPEIVERYKRYNEETPTPDSWDRALPELEAHYRYAGRLKALARG